MAGSAAFDIVFGSFTMLKEPAGPYVAQGSVGLHQMADCAECLSLMATLTLILLAVGIEAMRKTVVEFVNIFYEVISRVAFAAESFRMMAGSTIFPSEFGGKLMFMLETGLMEKRANLILAEMACGASGRGSNAVVTSETRLGIPHRRVIRGIQRGSLLIDIGMA
jgi:hypothetical protein